MKKIICIGSITKDVFISTKEAHVALNPGDATVQKLIGFEFGAKVYADSYREALGGSSINVAAGLLSCGMLPLVFSRVSNSDTGTWLLKQIGREKLKKRFIQRNGNVESEISIVISDSVHNDHVIFRTGDSVERFNLKKALTKFRLGANGIYIGSQKEGWEEKFADLIEFSKVKKVKIACNPSGFQISNGAERLLKLFPDFEVIFVNRDEAIELLEKAEGSVSTDIGPIFERLMSYGIKTLVITDGEKGAYVAKGEDIFYINTQAEEIVDTVGAGDAFSSGFFAAYLEFGDIKRAICWGIMNSASVISVMGGTKGLLKKKELLRREKDILPKINKIK